jgi:hypothetical protein
MKPNHPLNIILEGLDLAADGDPRAACVDRLKLWCGRLSLIGAVLLPVPVLRSATLPEWPYQQQLTVTSEGLQSVALPPETLHVAQPTLQDLRLVGPDGREVSYWIDRPALRPVPVVVRPRRQQVLVEPGRTRIQIERARTNRLQAIRLRTPTPTFVKSVSVDIVEESGSSRRIVSDRGIFRQTGREAQLQVELPGLTNRGFEVILDDRESAPIAIEGIELHELEQEPPPPVSIAATVRERFEEPGKTKLALDLGAAHLILGSLKIEAQDAVFRRRVSLLVSQFAEEDIREQRLQTVIVERLPSNHTGSSAEVLLDLAIPTRELVVEIENEDSPPLRLQSVQLKRRPVFLMFHAEGPGVFTVLSGHARAAAPRYDLPTLAEDLPGLPWARPLLGPLAPHPGFRPPAALPTVPLLGAALDVSPWSFRKPIRVTGEGVIELEPDLEIFGRALSGLTDLRLVTQGKQLPYVVDRTPRSRTFIPGVRLEAVPQRPSLTRWILDLPESGLPLTKLVCEAETPLFARDLRLFEEIEDGRGERQLRELGRASWRRTPDLTPPEYAIDISARLQSKRLMLETDNGDNPEIRLTAFRCHYTAARLLFRNPPGQSVELYYGNPRVSAPSYDLRLVADQILAAPRSSAALGPQESLRRSPWQFGEGQGTISTVVFWVALIGVVAGLLVLIVRLLPPASPTPPPES